MTVSMRAFLAVPVAGEPRRVAAGAAEALRATPRGRGVRWVRPETYHVTLRFLGEIPETSASAIAEAVAGAVGGVPPFELSLGPVVAFPSPRRPRVIVVQLEPEAPLRALAARVEEAVVSTGLDGEERPFRAHLTLGRVRDRVYPELPASPLTAPPVPVREVVLFRSELRKSGARHVPLRRLALASSHPDSVTPMPSSPEGDAHGEERPFPRAS